MPYIGNDLATQFQAFATQTITGDGSTSYTLDRAVANGKELLVYINNVKQEEGSGKSYEASGTTITFSEAVASTDSCYIVYMGSAQQTVTAPAGSIVSSQLATAFPSASLDMNGTELILDADGDTSIEASSDDTIVFDTAGSERMRIDAGGSVLIGQSTPTDLHNTWNHLIIGNRGSVISQNGAGGVDGMTVSYNAYIDADTGGYAYIATDEASILTQQNGILQYRNAASGTAGNAITFDTKLQIDADGHVTKPKQSAFLVTKSSSQTDTDINQNVLVEFDTERFDQNGDFGSNTFTAPVDVITIFNAALLPLLSPL